MKRFGVIIGVFSLCMLLTLGGFCLALRSARVQTAAVGLFTERLSDALGADVHMSRIDLRFINRLEIQDFYIGDKHGDTLISVPRLVLRFNPMALKDERLSFPEVRIEQPYVCFVQDSTSTNLDFLLRAFSSSSSSPTIVPTLNLDEVTIVDARLRYHHIPSSTDLLVSRFNAKMALPVLSSDTIDARVLALSLRAMLADMDACFEGSFHGNMDTICADRLEVWYHSQRLLLGSVRFVHPLLMDSMQARINCQDLFISAPLLYSLLSDALRRPVVLPRELSRLGDIHYRGLLEGRLDNLILHGAFITHLGTLTTDARVKAAMDGNRLTDLAYDARLTTRRFNIRSLFPGTGLTRVSASAQMKGVYAPDSPLTANVSARISELVYRDYHYSDLTFHGMMRDSIVSGTCEIRDPHLNMSLSAEANLASGHETLSSQLLLAAAPAELLGEGPVDKVACSVSLSIRGDGYGETLLDRLTGTFKIDSLYAEAHGHELLMKELSVVLTSVDGERRVRMMSDFVNAGVSGDFCWSTLGRTLDTFAARLFPTFLGKSAASTSASAKPNDLSFYVYLMNTDTITALLGSRCVFPYTQTVKGYMHESDGSYQIQAVVPSIVSGNSDYKHLTLSLENIGTPNEARLLFSARQHTIDLDSTQLRVGDIDVSLAVVARHDSLLTYCDFGEKDSLETANDLTILTSLTRYNRQPLISTHVQPSRFLLGDTLYTVEESSLVYNDADKTLSVSHFDVHSPSQHIRVEGIASPSVSDSIHVDLAGIDLHNLLRIVDLEKAVLLEGHISGWATLYGLFSAPMFEAQVSMPDAAINSVSLGLLSATATLEHESGHVLIDGRADLPDKPVATVTGRVKPKEGYWELFIDALGADLSLINFWTEGILDDIQGRGYGHIHVFGRHLRTWVTARAYAEDVSLTIPYTGGRYYFSDSVILDTTYVAFPAIHIRDAEGHTGIVSGQLNHTCFKDFTFHIGVECRDLLAMDLQPNPLRMYYGKAYASGRVDIKGDERLTDIVVQATSSKNTDFYLSIATASDASDNSFITFRQPESEQTNFNPYTALLTRMKAEQAEREPKGLVRLSLNMEATPDAKVHLLLNAHSGDGIVARGEGSLRLMLDEYGDVRLLGTYSLLSGTFSYSVANIVHRDFTIAEGSSISWSGRPEEPTLNITARYRCNPSLRDLFGSEASSISSRSTIPTDCSITMTGPLSSPVLRFGIEFPQTDESTAAQINAVINTEEMLMRQVVYLLVFNRFYALENMRTSGQGVNEAYSLLSSTVTGQINSWLSRLTDVIAFGFNVRTDGEGQTATTEYEAQFQLRPVNRLSINGNVGYRYNDLTNRPVFGDVDVEYELTPDGKLRIKAFTHTVDRYSLKQADMVEGIGFVFRHDFNIGDARRRRQARHASDSTYTAGKLRPKPSKSMP